MDLFFLVVFLSTPYFSRGFDDKSSSPDSKGLICVLSEAGDFSITISRYSGDRFVLLFRLKEVYFHKDSNSE